MWETGFQSLGQEDSLEKEISTHSNIAWRIPWTEEAGGLQTMGLQRVRHDLATEQEQHICYSAGRCKEAWYSGLWSQVNQVNLLRLQGDQNHQS